MVIVGAVLDALGIIFLIAGISGFVAGIKVLFGSSYYDLPGFEKKRIREMRIASVISLGSLFLIVVGAIKTYWVFF